MTADRAAAAGELRYYLHDYSDEVVPCDCRLESWAEWLSKPDDEWCRDEAAADGDQFKASVLRFEADIIATRGAEGWELSREPGDCSLLAVRFGPGLGWSPEALVYGDDMGAALREFLAEDDQAPGAVEHVAVGFDEPSVVLTYRADPPRLIVEGTVQ